MAVVFSMAWREAGAGGGDGTGQALDRLAAFRGEMYRCLGMRPDALFELVDAVLCKTDRVHMLGGAVPGAGVPPRARRGLRRGQRKPGAGGELRWSLACLPLRAWPDGRIRLAVDVSNWLRPDAETSPDRLFCHCCACGRGSAQMIPGWPYSVTAAQVRDVVARLIAAGHWKDATPPSWLSPTPATT